MKRLMLLSAGLLLVACSKKEPLPEPVRPVLSIEVKALNQEELGRFAGNIQARYESNVGFRVPGRIASRNVDVGTEVEKGALLATLDPTDQQNQLRSAEGDLARIQRSSSTPRPVLAASSNCLIEALAPRLNWTLPRRT